LSSNPIILKLGGSVITVKDKPFTANEDAILRLAAEIRKTRISLVIVHGGGSWGHPLAEKYGIREGFKEKTQILGFSKIRQAMSDLNKKVLDALIHEGISAVSVQPSSFIRTENGRIENQDMKTVANLLELGLTPVLYGDAVLDSILGFTILSGDQLISYLAVKLKADRIIIGVDTDGLYTADPKRNLSATLIPHISLKEIEEGKYDIEDTEVIDVTGGMGGKIFELIPALRQGVVVMLVNATKPEYLFRALKGKEVLGTIIEG
jgi:isopentenyl phosphate kinase